MTDSEKLDLILHKVVNVEVEVKEIKQTTEELREDVETLKTDVKELKEKYLKNRT